MTAMTGGCQCGRIRFTAEIEDDEAYLCHCRYCQRATGGVSIAFKNLPKSAVAWSREPDWYASSPIARRPFCSTCGTPLGFAFLEGENLDITIGAFDDPTRFRPTSHFGAESRLEAWIETAHLPWHAASDYADLQQRWKDAGARPAY